MAILGLLGTEQFASERFTSIRRSVFYQYPNGSAPLLGLLSMLDGEVLNDPEFSWYEKRLKELATETIGNAGTSGFWYADSSGALGAAAGVAAATKTAGIAYWIRVVDISVFTAHTVFRAHLLPITASSIELHFKVLPNNAGVFTSGTQYVRVTPVVTQTAVTNADGVNVSLQMLGTANEQGQTGADEAAYELPSTVGNAAQIFRTKYSFANTAIKTAAKFDETGPYKDRAKTASLNHMIGMELQFLFGNYSKSVDASSNLPTFTTGGLLFFMKLWEVGHGNTYAGVTSTYGNDASTQNTDDGKRIIDINGNITESDLDDYYERLFRHTNNVSNEKMAFVGSGFLNVINKLYKNSAQLNVDIPHADSYGMDVVKHISPFGTVYYKTHPLFNRSVILRHNALFMDVQNMKYRYVAGRDTDVIKHTEPNDADYRQDELRGECGLEVQFPESNMYMIGVTGVA